mmetsp:Transcript_4912/g.11909  ORF Transcript_4912/g.11909 Transcript_4912/m.11909 type:complete len:278 (-) Transcript_4912:57-890(-)
MKALEVQGVDSNTAKKLLQVWRDIGVDSSEDLRKLFGQRSRKVVTAVGLQTLVDVLACYISINAGGAFGAAGGWSSILAALSYALAAYYASNALFGIFVVISVLASGSLYGTDADAVLKAVKQLAGEDNLDVVNKAKRAVNMVKIVQSLNEISKTMKTQTKEETVSSLDRLTAYLTLTNAQKNFGFDPSKYNLSDSEAQRLAVKFARFDENDDGLLEKSEMENLFQAMDMELTPEEIDAALDLLDKRKSGFIEFDEFVDWYAKQIPVPKDAPVKSQN